MKSPIIWKRTRNTARISEFLSELMKTDVPATTLDTERTSWLAVIEDGKVAGLLSATAVTGFEARIQVFVPKERWKEKALGRALNAAALSFFEGPVLKLTMAFPANWQDSLSLAARMGFQREGLNKASFPGDEGPVDQLYLGRVRTA